MDLSAADEQPLRELAERSPRGFIPRRDFGVFAQARSIP